MLVVVVVPAEARFDSLCGGTTNTRSAAVNVQVCLPNSSRDRYPNVDCVCVLRRTRTRARVCEIRINTLSRLLAVRQRARLMSGQMDLVSVSWN